MLARVLPETQGQVRALALALLFGCCGIARILDQREQTRSIEVALIGVGARELEASDRWTVLQSGYIAANRIAAIVAFFCAGIVADLETPHRNRPLPTQPRLTKT